MDISKTIAELKKDPAFAENVGMVLVHNGVVRGWSRKDRREVSSIAIRVDRERLEQLRQEHERKPGIYRVIVEANEGNLMPGDDVLFILVAGDIREHVKPVLSDLLDRIKAEAVSKSESMS